MTPSQLQSWCNRETAIEARKDRKVNRILVGVLLFVALVLVASAFEEREPALVRMAEPTCAEMKLTQTPFTYRACVAHFADGSRLAKEGF